MPRRLEYPDQAANILICRCPPRLLEPQDIFICKDIFLALTCRPSFRGHTLMMVIIILHYKVQAYKVFQTKSYDFQVAS